MSDIKLRNFSNRNRFPGSNEKCPQCGEFALQDDWPPNYGGGSGSYQKWESWGNQKYVCTHCKIAFQVRTYSKTENGETETAKTIHDEVPLIEKDGYWLTPHDVWRETYKEEHGEYPREIYG